ncbi:MAG: flavodoxin family protein, partial [Clostridia bacterium]|nr:flavodoxin family protein [Clostridia bacterium]
MNIGLIVYSYTGNTLSVADKLKDQLQAQGHTATIERVHASNENPQKNRLDKTGSLTQAPDPAPYDALILAAPVNGFSLAKVMQDYLASCPGLAGKPVRLFVTHHFPKAWLGGSQTIRQFDKLCAANGAKI